MKYIHKYNIIEGSLSRLNSITTIEELDIIEKDFEKLDEGIYKFLKKKIKKIRNFFKGSNKPVDYILTGYTPSKDKKAPVRKEELLLVYKDPRVNNNKSIIYNGRNIPNMPKNFKSIFNTGELKVNLKSLKNINVSKRVIKEFPYDVEYYISIYAVLPVTDISLNAFKYDKLENITPSIHIYLKNMNKGFGQRLKEFYNKLLKLPNVYNKNTKLGFNINIPNTILDIILEDISNQEKKVRLKNEDSI